MPKSLTKGIKDVSPVTAPNSRQGCKTDFPPRYRKTGEITLCNYPREKPVFERAIPTQIPPI
jgi:hypothetical protein